MGPGSDAQTEVSGKLKQVATADGALNQHYHSDGMATFLPSAATSPYVNVDDDESVGVNILIVYVSLEN